MWGWGGSGMERGMGRGGCGGRIGLIFGGGRFLRRGIFRGEEEGGGRGVDDGLEGVGGMGGIECIELPGGGSGGYCTFALWGLNCRS